MTEKRFELVDIGFVYDNDKLIGMKEIVDLLNSLNDENEQLKQYAQTSKEFTEYVEDFFKKYDIDTVNFNALGEMIDADNFFYEKSLKLEKENEQLKTDKKRLIGYLHRYGFVDVEEVDELVLSKEYLDDWGELYNDER